MRKILVIYMIVCMTLLSGCSFMPMDSNPGANQSNQTDDNRKQGVQYSTDSQKNVKQQDVEKEKDSAIQENENLTRYTTFYYQDSEGLLIPITRKTPRIEGIGKASVRALVDTPVIREDIGRVGLYPVLPAGVEINGMTIRDGLAKVDFNKQIALGEYNTKQQERNILDAIVYTLTEFHTIDRVQILIEGHKYDTLKFGCPIAEPLTNKGINRLDNTEDDGSTNGELVEIYFTKLINNKYLYYVPVSRIIQNPTSDIETYMKTLKELIKGDVGDTHLKTYVPAQTTLNGIQVEGQTVILDFDDEILSATASNTSFDIMLNQILLCFKQFGKIRKVQITVNGKPLELPEKYAGKTVLEVPIYVNQF